MNRGGLWACFLVFACSQSSQGQTEFTKGWMLHVNARQGLTTRLTRGTEGYTGSLSLIPCYTMIPGSLRLGLSVGLRYHGQQVQAVSGPVLNLLLKTWHAGVFGSAANLHLVTEHLWAGKQHQAIGGGLRMELLQRIVLGPTVHRDYTHPEWWFQLETSYRLLRTRRKTESFNR